MPISLPKFLLKPFADTGAKADIPQISDQPSGRAGYDVGFPPLNMTPVAAGGIPPFGQDMNGVLFDLSKAIQYVQSGVFFPFDSVFATSIGGYAKGAIVCDSVDKSILWQNNTANNTQSPSVPNGWISISLSPIQATESVLGQAKVATQAQVNTGTDDTTIITPKKLRAGFAVSINRNGFIAFPSWMGGIIIQWGSVVVPNGSTATFTFPTAFPTECFQAGPIVNNGTTLINLSSGVPSLNSVSITAGAVGGSGFIIAIGK